MKLTVELPAASIAISSPMPTCSPMKPGNRSRNRQNSSRQCWCASWQPIEAFAKARRKGQPAQGKQKIALAQQLAKFTMRMP
ncbi:hypothetical protein V1277_005617 [Bradyrhizobium sp. AZCC 1588]